jgi:creatinine amidohydrolase
MSGASEGLARLRHRIAETPAHLRAFDPAALATALAEDAAPRALVASGAGSSLEHARLLCALLAATTGIPARVAPPSALLEPPGSGADGSHLVVFSQGLSPNGRALLAHARAWRRVWLVTGAAPEAEDAERAAALARLEEAGGRVLRLPAPREAGLLLRVIGPLLGSWAAIEIARALAPGAGGPGRAAAIRAERVCAALDAAASRGRALRASAPGDPLPGELAILAGSGAAAGGGLLARKLLEGLLVPLPPVWDLVDFAHGGFQQLFARRATLLAPLAPGGQADAALLARAEAMLDPARHRVLRLEAELPAPYALLEHEVVANELLLGAIEARGLDPARWPGQDRDAPLYALAAAPEADAAPRALARLAWPELEALLASGSLTAVLPLGSTEQHGPHLPFATDTLVADALAARFCARVPGSVRLPALPFGCASEHLGFPGTIHLSPETLASILEDALGSLSRHGFRRALVFSAHGGNTALLRGAAERLARAAPGLDVVVFADAGRVEAALHRAAARFGVAPEAAGHHAGEVETSLLLALAPGEVREGRAPGLAVAPGAAASVFYPDLRARAPSGVVGDPRGARPERAAAYLDAWVDLLVEAFEAAKKRACAKGTNQA